MEKEVELKLRLLGDYGMALYDHPTVARYCQAEPTTVDVETTYFDTDDYLLAQASLALRIRHTEIDGYIQTVKSKGSESQGLHTRIEWDTPVWEKEIDLTVIQDEKIQQDIVAIAIEHEIKPVFETHFARTKWDLKLTDTLWVELAWDQGEVKVEDKALPINEIELELKKGDLAYVLFELAADIAHALPVTIERNSKAWRGYQLHQAAVSHHPYQTPEAEDRIDPAFFLEQAAVLKGA